MSDARTYVVVVADRVAESGLVLLRAEPRLDVVTVENDRDRLRAELARAHGLIVRSGTTVDDSLLAGAPELVVIGRAGTGVDNIDVSAATRRGVAVLNAPGANTVSAAEHTIALLLALMRRIPDAALSMRSGRWDRKRFAGTELRGKTLGVVGLGRIGAHVAAIARAFGMRILAHDPYLPGERAAELGVELVSLDELLPEADVLTLHLPLTDETRCLLNAERLRSMKRHAVVINTARGALVDQDALLEEIEADRIAGAALDVFDPEPLAEDSPLRRSERVILTPHLAASTSEAQERVAQEICAAVRDALLTGSVGGAINLPGLSRDVLVRLRGLLELARRLGRLAVGLSEGAVHSVEVAYGGEDELAPRPVMLAALEGVLAGMGVSPVRLVNAAVLAAARGVAVSHRAGHAQSGFETTVGVTLDAARRSVSVVGALVGERVGRVIRIDEFDVDIPADGHIIVLKNRDVPGVIGRVGGLLGEANINIASYHQSRLETPGSDALAAIVADDVPSKEIMQRLEALPDVLEVRFAEVNGGP